MSWLVYIFLLTSKPAVAAVAKPAISPSLILVEVVYGERKTWYKIDNAHGRPTIEFANNLGQRRTLKLTRENFEFVEKEVKDLTGPNNRPELCSRTYIRIYSHHGEKFGCFGAPNPLAQKMKMFATVISRLF